MSESFGDRPTPFAGADPLTVLYELLLRAERNTGPIEPCAIDAALKYVAVHVAAADQPGEAIGTAHASRQPTICHMTSDRHDLRRLFTFAQSAELGAIFLVASSPNFTSLDGNDAVNIVEALLISIEHAAQGVPTIVRYFVPEATQRRRDRPVARCQLTLIERRLLPEVLERSIVQRVRWDMATSPTVAPVAEAVNQRALVGCDETASAELVGPLSTMATALRRAKALHGATEATNDMSILNDDERLRVMLGGTAANGTAAFVIGAAQLTALPPAPRSAMLILCEADLTAGLPAGVSHARAQGWSVAVPTTPATVVGFAAWAHRSSTPLVMLVDPAHEHTTWGPLPLDDDWSTPLGCDRVVVRGDGLTIVATGADVEHAVQAAQILADESHTAATVIEAHSIEPLGSQAAAEAVRLTHRVLIVRSPNDPLFVSDRLASIISQTAFFELDAPPTIVTSSGVDSIVTAARSVLAL